MEACKSGQLGGVVTQNLTGGAEPNPGVSNRTLAVEQYRIGVAGERVGQRNFGIHDDLNGGKTDEAVATFRGLQNDFVLARGAEVLPGNGDAAVFADGLRAELRDFLRQ